MSVQVNLIVWILTKCMFAIIIARLLTARGWRFMDRNKTHLFLGTGIILLLLGGYWFLTSLNYLLAAVDDPMALESNVIQRHVKNRDAGGNLSPLGMFFLMVGAKHLSLFRKK